MQSNWLLQCFICACAGKLISTGYHNFAVGRKALGGGAAAAMTGNHNFVAGNEAGELMTTAEENIIIGKDAGKNLTESERNVLFGSSAGKAITDEGNANVFIGPFTGCSSVSGDFSVAIGCGTLRSMTGTGCNIAFGRMAGEYLTTGNHNFFAGNYTAKWHRGSGNIAIGQQALYGNSTCADNTGGYNIAFGHHAGSENCSGTGNIFLGKNAGPTQTASSGGCNIIMGWDYGD